MVRAIEFTEQTATWKITFVEGAVLTVHGSILVEEGMLFVREIVADEEVGGSRKVSYNLKFMTPMQYIRSIQMLEEPIVEELS